MPEEKYALLKKEVGQTPLETLERWRTTRPDLEGVSLAYAGRLDPMASGQLLVLIGEECKKQTEYHNLDKEYQIGVLFGIKSDSGDVLGIVNEFKRPDVDVASLEKVLDKLVGEIEFPYPIFSSKTVQGKPLHTWAVENRLSEITIPTRRSHIYKLRVEDIKELNREDLVNTSLSKIELIPPVTDPRKAIGNDFRRPDVRIAWGKIKENGNLRDNFYLANITCICSSGTYMRTLAERIANEYDTEGLAFSINRNCIGKYDKDSDTWTSKF